jgi:hypothetical protein
VPAVIYHSVGGNRSFGIGEDGEFENANELLKEGLGIARNKSTIAPKSIAISSAQCSVVTND